MAISKDKDGTEYITIPLKDYKTLHRFYFTMCICSIGVGFVLGGVISL